MWKIKVASFFLGHGVHNNITVEVNCLDMMAFFWDMVYIII